jgi:hypothetical protein
MSHRPKNKVTKLGDKYVIKINSHDWWCDMIFIQLVVFFASPRQGLGIKHAQLVG